MRRISFVLLAAGLLLGLYLLAPRSTSPTARTQASVANPASPVAATETPAYYKWGHALQSAAEDGTGFYDLRRADRFVNALPKDQQRYALSLLSRAFLPDEGNALEALPADAPFFAYVQFHEIPDPAERAAFEAAGVPLDHYITAQTWSFSATAGQLKQIAARKNVRAILPADPRDKVHPLFYLQNAPAHAQRPENRVELAFIARKGSAAKMIVSNEALLADARLSQPQSSVLGDRYTLTVPATQNYRDTALALARSVAVSYVEPAASPMASRGDAAPVRSRDATTDDTSNVSDVRDQGLLLSGDGVIVAVREIGRPSSHIDYSSRLTELAGEISGFATDTANVSHGTSVCGQIAGQGFNNPAAKGVAPRALLRTYAVNPDAFGTSDISDSFNAGARISNHSYGPVNPGLLGDYRVASADYDDALRATGQLGLFAGNEVGTPQFIGQDYFVGAKNTVLVSATTAAAHAGDDSPQRGPSDGIAPFSFFGPMIDGRIKPDLMAFGVDVNLLDGTAGETVASGTSFSTPATAGIAALILEHYRKVIGVNPSGAMLKALLCNSATDLGQPGPDAQYGFGIVNAEAAANLVSLGASPEFRPFSEGVIGATTSNGNTFTTAINVDNSGQPLRVMLCWFDRPGTPGVTRTLVNDLDLKISKDGVDYFPYSLNKDAPAAAATRSAKNNVDPIEQIVIENPASGTYTVTITANLPNSLDVQPFALVSNRPPAELPVTATIIASPTTGPAPLDVSFQAGTLNLGANATYVWNFGDGTTGTGFNVTHVYQTPGLKNVTMTVTFKGKPDTATAVINVTKREVTSFSKKAQLSMKYALDKDTKDDSLQFSVVIPELVRTPQQSRDAIRDGLFEGEAFDIVLTYTPEGGAERTLNAETALLNRRAQFKTQNTQFQINLTRGEVSVRLKKIALDEFFALDSTSASQSLGSFRVRLSGVDVDYTADLPLDYVKAGKGGRAKYPLKR